jgi:hypothetical protein
MVYEVATFQALRELLRCKEIWVVGTGRWRDPDEDLPKDFEARREEHYESLRKPLDPAEFIDGLRQEMEASLAALDDALPRLGWLDIAERPAGAIRLTPIEAAPEPRNLRRIKSEVARRWTAVPLVDVLKEAVLRNPVGRLGRARARGGDPLRPPPLPDPRGGPDGRHRDRQRDLRHPRPRPVGRGQHRCGVGLHALPVLGPEPVHRVALPLRRRLARRGRGPRRLQNRPPPGAGASAGRRRRLTRTPPAGASGSRMDR